MANPVSWFLSKIFGFFSNLDTETKERIVDMIVEAFQGAFRSYYQKKRYEETGQQNGEQTQSSDDPNVGTAGTGDAK